ncbi:hypothetical protein ABK040_012866 [Willaertia magna]
MVQSSTTQQHINQSTKCSPPTLLEKFRTKNNCESRVEKFLKYEREKERKALSSEDLLQIPTEGFQNNYFVWDVSSIRKQSPVKEREKHKSPSKGVAKSLSQVTNNVGNSNHQTQHEQQQPMVYYNFSQLLSPTISSPNNKNNCINSNFNLQLHLSDEAIEELRDYPLKYNNSQSLNKL